MDKKSYQGTLKQPTQRQMVLMHLLKYGSIEPLTALREYGCYRLGAVIFMLRDEGWKIDTQRMEAYSKITGRKVNYAQYKLKEQEREL